MYRNLLALVLAGVLLTGCTGATYIIYRLSQRLYTAP